MAGKTSAEREALDVQVKRIMAVFTRTGFDFIAPDIIQPADMFLDSSGENIRSRTYIFTDPMGAELCLRPDLTVPACRYHLSHAEDVSVEARYCYSGPAFRHQADGQAGLHPAEFDQAGIEWFNAVDPVVAEAEILSLANRAMEAVGLKQYTIRLGDLGLFRALLDSIDMPERWRRRLRHQFWRPRAFRELLDLLSGITARTRTSISEHVDAIAGTDLGRAMAYVEKELAARDLPAGNGRTLQEIALRLLEKSQDRGEKPLALDQRKRIEDYLALECAAADAGDHLATLSGAPKFARARDDFARRLKELKRRRIDTDTLRFSADFGRKLEYYTGFVFEIEALREGEPVQVAGGGRYDSLMSDIGASMKIPAVGCAIHTERLLAVMKGQR